MTVLKLVRYIFTNWLGHGLNVVVLFFLTPYVVAQLGETQYGVWSTVIMLTGYLGVLDIGIRSSTGRFIILYLGRRDAQGVNETIRTSLGFFSLTALAVLVAALALGFIVPHQLQDMPPELISIFPLLLLIVSVNSWLAAVSVVYSSVLTGRDRFDLMQAVNVGMLIIRSVGTVFVLTAGYGLIALAVVTLLANVAGLCGNVVLAHRLYRPLRSWPLMLNRARLKELFGFGIPVFVSSVASRILSHTDLLLIGLMLSVALVTEYSICSMLILYAWGFIELVVASTFPSIQRAAARDEMDNVRALVLRMSRLTVLFGLLPYVGFIVFGREFLALWVPTLADKVPEAALLLAVLSFARIVALFSEGLSPALQSIGIVRIPAALAIIESIINALLSLALVLPFGILGIAAGTLVAMTIMRGIVVPIYTFGKLQLPGLHFVRLVVMPAMLAALLFAGASLLILLTMPVGTWQAFFTKVAAATAAYGLISFLVLISSDQRRQLLALALRPLRRQGAEA